MTEPPEDLLNFPAGATREQYEGEWIAECGCSWTVPYDGRGKLHAKCEEHWLD